VSHLGLKHGLSQESVETKASALVIAIEDYSLHAKLENLTASANDLAKVLGQVCLVDLPSGKMGSSELEKQIKSWFEQATSEERLVMFWTGHGERESSRLYLMTHDSPTFQFDSTNAVEPGFIAKCAAFSKAKKILLFIDTCHSGAAVRDIIVEIANVMNEQSPDAMRHRGIAVIASAHAIEKAQANVVCRAFKDALIDNSFSRRWTDSDCYIDGDLFTDALMDEVERRGIEQQMVPATYGRPAQLIPNPRFRANLPAENVEERRWRLSQSDAAEHFELAARGIEVGETGWFFCGRKRLLLKLVDWLNTAENGVRIVTGPPGTGKSAVVGRLATLSDPEYRQEAIKVGAVKEGADPVPPVGAIEIAVHAKGKTLDDCGRALAAGLRIELGREASIDVDRLVTEMGKLDRKVTLLIDALDEAAAGQGGAIASRLIVPLGRLPQVKVLVGSRRSLDGAVVPEAEDRHGRLRAAFGADAVIDDLADDKDTRGDIADYVRRRLASSDKHRNDDPAIIQRTAERVAEKAEGIFLYARIVSRTLQEQNWLDGPLPEGALDAFEQDIKDRFKGEERRVDDLLDALAWGEGKGLTRRLWPLVANSLAAREPPYNDDDVAWILGQAGWHIIEAGKDGQTVYRLAHQALADHYRAKFNEKDAQGRIVAALTYGIAGADWLDCDHYIWRHLADHAAKAHRLDDLIRDPGYLAVADPSRLVIVLSSVESAEGRRYADIYERVFDRLIDVKPIERMAYIHMTAQMEDPELAPPLEPPAPVPWRCRWARLRPSTPHRVIGRHLQSDDVKAVALTSFDGCPIVASQGYQKIYAWDVRTGTPVGEPLILRDDPEAVALGTVDGHAAVVSAKEKGSVRLLDVRKGVSIAQFSTAEDEIDAVALGAIAGHPAVALANHDDKTIRLWDAVTCQPIGRPLKGKGYVTAIALGMVDERPIVVSGHGTGTLQFWDVITGELIGKSQEAYQSGVGAVAFGTIDGMPIVISGCWDDSRVLLWNPRTGESVGEPLIGHTDGVDAIAIGTIDGDSVVVTGSRDGTVRLWDVHTPKQIGEPLEGHWKYVRCVAVGAVEGRPAVISGGGDMTVRLWDLRSARVIEKPQSGHTKQVSSVVFGRVRGYSIAVSGGDDQTIRVWDAYTGEPAGEPLRGHRGPVKSVAFGTFDRRSIVVSGSWDGTVRLWDARTGKSIGKPLKGHGQEVNAVAFANVERRPVVISKGWDLTIRFWDARTGKPIGKPISSGGSHVLELATINGRTILVSGEENSDIRFWDIATHEPVGEPFEAFVGQALAFGTVDGHPILVSGDDLGYVNFWHADVLPVKGAFPRSFGVGMAKEHTARVKAVAIGTTDTRPIAISGGEDGTIRLWDARTQMELRVVKVGASVTSIDYRSDLGVLVGSNTGIILLDIRPAAQ
jgi:WD40 repeat protein